MVERSEDAQRVGMPALAMQAAWKKTSPVSSSGMMNP